MKKLDFCKNGIFLQFAVDDDGRLLIKHIGTEMVDTAENKFFTVTEVFASGENADDHHGAKHTGTSASKSLRYCSHKYYENMLGNKLELELSDAKLAVTVHYQFYTDISAVRAWTVVKNISNANVGLEYVSSFSYTGLENDKPSYYNSS